MLLSWVVSFFSKHFFTGWALKRQWRVGKGQRAPEVCELQWPCPCTSSPTEREPSSLYDTLCMGTHLSGKLSLYFTVIGDILVSRCHGEVAPLPRRSLRQHNQWNNEVPRSWGWNSGGPSWAQRSNPSPSEAPMKLGISRSVADDKSVSVCPRFFPGPGEDPGWGERETQTHWPRDGSFGGHLGQPVCTALIYDPGEDQTRVSTVVP